MKKKKKKKKKDLKRSTYLSKKQYKKNYIKKTKE